MCLNQPLKRLVQELCDTCGHIQFVVSVVDVLAAGAAGEAAAAVTASVIAAGSSTAFAIVGETVGERIAKRARTAGGTQFVVLFVYSLLRSFDFLPEVVPDEFGFSMPHPTRIDETLGTGLWAELINNLGQGAAAAAAHVGDGAGGAGGGGGGGGDGAGKRTWSLLLLGALAERWPHWYVAK
ncbi:hypothetical protein T492DRAFT_847573 [Pavlovales sp. CCMP2436]|nr:hypothetical protein T492DRAFT_847573 [Pavlovales sp. CCMP2436]